MDVPTPVAGTVVEVLINTGDKVKQGSLSDSVYKPHAGAIDDLLLAQVAQVQAP